MKDRKNEITGPESFLLRRIYKGGILIANRGEIAVRVIGAARKNGIRSVAVYAPDDADSLHVSVADEAILLNGDTLPDTYLNQEKIIRIALESGVSAIHPGYGFLSENAGFAQAVNDAGLIFIGPTPENISLMGDKNRALSYIESLGVPILKSFRGDRQIILKQSALIEFPVMVKASGGGGGKGMLICNSAEDLIPTLEKAERQAISYFGNGELFVEKYLTHARHIEVQLMADNHGNVLNFYERECSVQRRFQKIIEEAPSPSIDEKIRRDLTTTAVKIARSMNYRNAGTIEFLLDESGKFYFLEMNTRIQVEHPVTEMVTGIDLVSLQLLVAAGLPLPIQQDEIRVKGHAIEFRLCAEDAENGFKPSAGKLSLWQIPQKENTRIETFVKEGLTISAGYDSMLAKLIVWGENRTEAIQCLQELLSGTAISGIHTNLLFLKGILEGKYFQENSLYTRYVDEHLSEINQQIQHQRNLFQQEIFVIAYLINHFQKFKSSENSVWSQIGFWRIFPETEIYADGVKYECFIESGEFKIVRINQKEFRISAIRIEEKVLTMEVDKQTYICSCVDNFFETEIVIEGFSVSLKSNLFLNQASVSRENKASKRVFQNLIRADLFGRVLKINISEGEEVNLGENLLVLESMKTEINVRCPMRARVKKIWIDEGNTVIDKQLLIELQNLQE